MSRTQIQSLINKAPESWKKMFRRYGLSSKPTVSKLINTVLEHTPSMRSSGQKGKAIHKVPENVKDEAMEGIYLSWEHNYTSDSGIGLVRAMQLVVKDKIPDRSVKRMSSYFARSKLPSPKFPPKGSPKQYMAWLNWGGDAGKKWSDRIAKKLRNPRDSQDNIEIPVDLDRNHFIIYTTAASLEEQAEKLGFDSDAALKEVFGEPEEDEEGYEYYDINTELLDEEIEIGIREFLKNKGIVIIDFEYIAEKVQDLMVNEYLTDNQALGYFGL